MSSLILDLSLFCGYSLILKRSVLYYLKLSALHTTGSEVINHPSFKLFENQIVWRVTRLRSSA